MSKVNLPSILDFYKVDDSERETKSLYYRDSDELEVRFENCSVSDVCFQLNKLLTDVSVVYVRAGAAAPSASGSLSVDGEQVQQVKEDLKISGFYKGTIFEIVRDLALNNGLSYEVFQDKYYLSEKVIDIDKLLVCTSLETTLEKEKLDELRSVFSQEVFISLNGSKLLVSGRLRQVKQYIELVDQLNEVPRSYVCNLVLVKVNRRLVSDCAARVSASSLDLISRGWSIYDVFQAQLDINLDKYNQEQYLEQSVYCTDGKKSSIQIGSEVQKERRSISDQGTSTVQGYEKFSDGVQLELSPFRSVHGRVDVELSFSSSKFNNVSDLAKDQIDIKYERISLEENRLYFIGCFNENMSERGAAFLGLNSNDNQSVISAWLLIKSVAL